MIVLENLKKIGNIIEADYYYDFSDAPRGHFKYDITIGKYIEIKRAEENEWGFGHIERDLQRLIRHNVFPEKRVILWY